MPYFILKSLYYIIINEVCYMAIYNAIEIAFPTKKSIGRYVFVV